LALQASPVLVLRQPLEPRGLQASARLVASLPWDQRAWLQVVAGLERLHLSRRQPWLAEVPVVLRRPLHHRAWRAVLVSQHLSHRQVWPAEAVLAQQCLLRHRA
jgi:hypothetical protein